MTTPSHEDIRQAAIDALRLNDLGTMTTAAPNLYPHMWSWDAAFITIGLARVDIPRAITELQTLLAAQWSTGMIPHIVFSDNATDYFPGADRWGTASAPARPAGLQTSGICQPPVHAQGLGKVVVVGLWPAGLWCDTPGGVRCGRGAGGEDGSSHASSRTGAPRLPCHLRLLQHRASSPAGWPVRVCWSSSSRFLIRVAAAGCATSSR